MAKEDAMLEEMNAKKIAEIERKHREEMDELRDKIQLLQIIATKQASVIQPENQQQAVKKVTQINVGSKSYFCVTPQEKSIFFENNPNAKKYICKDCGERFDRPATENKKLICPKCHSATINVYTEIFTLELFDYIADKYLNDPENKKQFIRKGK